MMNISRDPLFAQFNQNPPASREIIDRIQEKLEFHLPTDYIEFLLISNGGEGFFGKSYCILWKAEELITMNADYHVTEFVPKLFLIGSDGGDEAFGFDTRSEACKIVSVPFIGMDWQLAKTLANDFKKLFSALSAS